MASSEKKCTSKSKSRRVKKCKRKEALAPTPDCC
jgi:hypothetical protein